ncbi:MAG: capsular biosynthesis protein, partial [Pseudomonadota bacterium]
MALAEAPRREQDATAGARTVCLLQGPSSYFFDLLGDALISEGASAFRVCFCAGDRLFWRRKPHVWFRGGLSAWPAALRALIEERGVTDLVMLGDSRARHRAALAVAKAAGVLGHVVEHGYFRPDWLTHEIGGMGPRSSVRLEFREGRLPDAAPGSPPDAARIYRSSFAAYAAMDVAYNLSNVFTRPILAPRYEGHSTVWPLVEYAGWLRKLAVAPARARRAKAALARAAESERPMFL